MQKGFYTRLNYSYKSFIRYNASKMVSQADKNQNKIAKITYFGQEKNSNIIRALKIIQNKTLTFFVTYAKLTITQITLFYIKFF